MCSTCEGDDWFYAVSTGNCNGPVLTVHSCSWKKKRWFTLGNGHRISLYLCSFPVAWMSVPNQAGSSVSIERTQKMVPCAKCIQFPTWYFGGYPVVSHIHIYIYIYIYVRLSKLLVHEKDINIIWKGPIANHSFVAILPSLRNIDLQGVSLRLNAAEVDMILYS